MHADRTGLSILACGEVLWDLFPAGPSFGGAPANFACHAALLGGAVSILTAIGDDSRGQEALSILESFNIDTALVQSVKARPTGSVGVELDKGGKPSFEIHPNSAWDHITWTREIESRVGVTDAIYFGTLGQRATESRATILRAVSMAKERGIPRFLDINLRRPFFDNPTISNSIALASVLKLSDDELPTVTAACGVPDFSQTSETLQTLRAKFGLDAVAMTRGADGAMLVTADSILEHPGVPTKVRDTVGAGDSFTAALTIGVLRGAPLDEILSDACRVAAAVCAHEGAVPMNSGRAGGI